MLFADGLKDAFVGVAYQGYGHPDLAVYSVPKALKVMMERDGMTSQAAQDYLEAKSLEASKSPNAPLWLFPMDYKAWIDHIKDDMVYGEEPKDDEVYGEEPKDDMVYGEEPKEQPKEKLAEDDGCEPQLRTPGLIARELGEPLHRIQYLLRTRDHIRPTARAGLVRLFDREAVSQLRHELNAIDARRSIRI